MTDYTLAFSTAVKGQSLPPAKISLNAKGNEQQVNLDKLTVAALEGKTELKALLDWQQAISWRGELTLNGINTAKEVPDWPSKLNGLIKTQGSLYGGSWQMSVPELKITGNVKQNKVDVSGSLQGNSYMQWKIPGLHLALGPNSADVKGGPVLVQHHPGGGGLQGDGPHAGLIGEDGHAHAPAHRPGLVPVFLPQLLPVDELLALLHALPQGRGVAGDAVGGVYVAQ